MVALAHMLKHLSVSIFASQHKFAKFTLKNYKQKVNRQNTMLLEWQKQCQEGQICELC